MDTERDDDPLPDLLPPVPDRAFWMAEPDREET